GDLASAKKGSQDEPTQAAISALSHLMAVLDEAAALSIDAGGGQRVNGLAASGVEAAAPAVPRSATEAAAAAEALFTSITKEAAEAAVAACDKALQAAPSGAGAGSLR
ncbi:unnamed protein product, partial [Polarella glacialis]